MGRYNNNNNKSVLTACTEFRQCWLVPGPSSELSASTSQLPHFFKGNKAYRKKRQLLKINRKSRDVVFTHVVTTSCSWFHCAMEVDSILSARKAQYKTTDVSKEVELQYDLGNLLATDLNPLDEGLLR